MRNIFSFSVTIILVNYLHGASLNNVYSNFENQLQRTIRQTNVEECAPPTIPNGNIKILKKKSNKKNNFLSLNVTCEYNYILQPPDDYLMSCFNGFWDVDETPQCKRCIKRSENIDNENDADSQLTCPEPITGFFKDCGHRIDKTHQPFVVNGTLSKFAEFPWHVAIYKKDQIDTLPVYHCGGSIINEKSILTVAHCFSDGYGRSITSREYYAAAGKYHRFYNSDSETTQKRKIVGTHLHPRYQGELTNFAWDIAVVIVDEPYKISTIVHPVCIDWRTNFENEHLSTDTYGEVAGWGKTGENFNDASAELRVLRVPFIKAAPCISLVPSTFIRYITHDKFCAGYTNGSSVCDGDSGGGLVFERLEKGQTKYYIRGLVSVGLQDEGRCDNYKYSTYTKVSEYIPFIREIIQNKNIKATVLSIYSTTTDLPTTTETTTEASISCKTPNNEEAKCISIYDCKIFVTALQNSPAREEINFMKESICGKQEERKVCCGSAVNYLSTIHAYPATIKPIEHKNLNLLPPPGVCGRRTVVSQNRSFHETVAEILDHPWIVLLEFGTPANSAGFLCLGSLINERYVLTAAHCVVRTRIVDAGQLFRVRLGEYDFNNDIDCVDLSKGTGLLPNGRNCSDPPLNVNIERINIHPQFDARKRKNDIALIRLAKSISYTDFIKPICLPLQGETSLPGKEMVVVKWGRDDIGFSNSMKENSFISIISDEVCAKRYASIGRVQLDSSNICASSVTQAKDDCKDTVDTGGPLMGTLFNSTDFYAEGVISYTANSCGNNFPVVATKVTSNMDWILNVLEP